MRPDVMREYQEAMDAERKAFKLMREALPGSPCRSLAVLTISSAMMAKRSAAAHSLSKSVSVS